MSNAVLDYPFSKAARLDVDPRYKEIRGEGLVKIQMAYGEPCWLATSYADAKAAYDFRKFGRSEGLTRIRQLAAGAFSPDRIQMLTQSIQAIVDELLDDIEAAGPGADFVKLYSHILPVRVLAGVLGIPADRAMEFKQWVDISSAFDSSEETKLDARSRTIAFIRDLIARRREQESTDLLSILVHARDNEDSFGEEELVMLAMALWHGGFKTTLWQLGTTVYTLMTHPDHWRELVENPGIMSAALNELWRWIPSFKYGVPFVFWAKEDVEFSHGKLVRKGDPVLIEFAVANRDDAAFPNADTLDFHRVKPQPHLSFTAGAHSCIGQHLARLQIRLTIESLIRRFPHLQLAIPEEQVEFDDSSFMRSVEALPLTW
jgi:cytochrome P450